MSKLIVTGRDKSEAVVDAKVGFTVMEIVRDAGFDDEFALCGGGCSCATCHVYIAENFVSLLPPMSDAENDLLDGSGHRRANSRLSCQVPFQEALDGMAVTIAPVD